jgi:hypothetical protein
MSNCCQRIVAIATRNQGRDAMILQGLSPQGLSPQGLNSPGLYPSGLSREDAPRQAYLDLELTDPVTSSNSSGSLGRAVAPARDTTAALLIPRSFPCGLFHGAKSIMNSATIPTTATIAATIIGIAMPGAFFPCACN